MLFWRLLPTSHRILLVFGTLYFVNVVALHGYLSSLFALVPSETLNKWQYWRVLTYPLAIDSFWSIITASAVFYFFAPEVEHILSTRKFVTALALFGITHAAVYIPIMWSSNLALAGPTAASLFVLTLYTYIYPSGELSLFGLFSLRAKILLAGMVVISLLMPLFSQPMNPIGFIHVFADELFGVFSGFLFAYLYFGSRSDDSFTLTRKQPQAAPRRTATSTASAFPTLQSTAHDEERSLSLPIIDTSDDNTYLDEDRLNEILDKITEKGQGSLTSAERKFLQDYAKKL
jgi:membrane associated rhomboid family serine protease